MDPGMKAALVPRRMLRRLGFDLIPYPYTEPIFQELADFLPRLGINCVLDVGAHHGEYARALRRIGYPSRIVSFEPDPASVVELEAAAASDRDWPVRPFALGREGGRQILNVAQKSVQSSFRQLHPGARVERQVEVEMRRLDETLFGECVVDIEHPRVFVKLDVQGLELEVLEGVSGVLQRLVVLQGEVAPEAIYAGAPAARDVLGFVAAAAFRLAGAYAVSRDADYALKEADCLWVRRAG